MASVGRRAAVKAQQLLSTAGGISENLAAMQEVEGIDLPEIGTKQIVMANVTPDLIERTLIVKYPTVHVYCEKFVNLLREKFRTFSGTVHLAVEVRVSQDRLEELERALQIYVDVITRVLDQNRGDWGNGMFYTGGYEAVFDTVKHGGRNFIQSGRVRFQVEVSLDA